jgi:glycosyltransferase involved in cell wall biosynthesis
MSIKNQLFKDSEVIIVNDGSAVSNLSVVEKIVSDYSRFKIITQKYGGLSVARNLGVKHSTRDYITF